MIHFHERMHVRATTFPLVTIHHRELKYDFPTILSVSARFRNAGRDLPFSTTAGPHEAADEIDSLRRREETDGVIMGFGGVAAGIVLYLNDGIPVFDYNFFEKHTVLKAKKPLPSGDSTVEVDFDYL